MVCCVDMAARGHLFHLPTLMVPPHPCGQTHTAQELAKADTEEGNSSCIGLFTRVVPEKAFGYVVYQEIVQVLVGPRTQVNCLVSSVFIQLKVQHDKKALKACVPKGFFKNSTSLLLPPFNKARGRMPGSEGQSPIGSNASRLSQTQMSESSMWRRFLCLVLCAGSTGNRGKVGSKTQPPSQEGDCFGQTHKCVAIFRSLEIFAEFGVLCRRTPRTSGRSSAPPPITPSPSGSRSMTPMRRQACAPFRVVVNIFFRLP